jgi:hypothetical protein
MLIAHTCTFRNAVCLPFLLAAVNSVLSPGQDGRHFAKEQVTVVSIAKITMLLMKEVNFMYDKYFRIIQHMAALQVRWLEVARPSCMRN